MLIQNIITSDYITHKLSEIKCTIIIEKRLVKT